jgi:uncharacterized protein
MPAVTHDFDLAGLRLSAGEGRRLGLTVAIDPLELGGQRYEVQPASIPAILDVSRINGGGYALRLRLQAALRGPCMRCLKDAAQSLTVDAREVDLPDGDDDDLSSPYVSGELLDLAAWARDAFALLIPVQVVCREDCAGLCPICAADLNEAGPEHQHDAPPDPRWAKLRELKLQ